MSKKSNTWIAGTFKWQNKLEVLFAKVSSKEEGEDDGTVLFEFYNDDIIVNIGWDLIDVHPHEGKNYKHEENSEMVIEYYNKNFVEKHLVKTIFGDDK